MLGRSWPPMCGEAGHSSEALGRSQHRYIFVDLLSYLNAVTKTEYDKAIPPDLKAVAKFVPADQMDEAFETVGRVLLLGPCSVAACLALKSHEVPRICNRILA